MHEADGNGLNVLSPTLENNLDSSVWTCQTSHLSNRLEFGRNPSSNDHLEVAQYRCGPRKVQAIAYPKHTISGDKTDTMTLELFRKQFSLPIPNQLKDFGLKVGSTIYLTIEIYKGQFPYPFPFAGRPEPAAYSDWKEINSVGIMGKWYDSCASTWRNHHFEAPRSVLSKSALAREHKYTDDLYLTTRFLIDTLEQIDWSSPANFLRPRARIVVKDLKYNHLDLTVTLTNRAATIRHPPILLSFHKNADTISKLYDPIIEGDPGLAVPANRTLCNNRARGIMGMPAEWQHTDSKPSLTKPRTGIDRFPH